MVLILCGQKAFRLCKHTSLKCFLDESMFISKMMMTMIQFLLGELLGELMSQGE